jgi:hypothetical protein
MGGLFFSHCSKRSQSSLTCWLFLSLRGDTKYTRHIGGSKEPEKRGKPNGGGEPHLRDRIRSFRLVSPHLFFWYTLYTYIHKKKKKKKKRCLFLFLTLLRPQSLFFCVCYLIWFYLTTGDGREPSHPAHLTVNNARSFKKRFFLVFFSSSFLKRS